MSNTTPNYMRGLIVPTQSISQENIWGSQSNFTQSNPRAGIPSPAQDGTSLVVTCAGTQGETIKIQTNEGGVPGENASFTWEGENGVQLGKDHDNLLTDFKYWKFTSSPGYEDFDCVADTDGTIYTVSELIVGGVYSIACHSQKQNGTVDTKKTFFASTLSSSPNTTAKPMITILNDGSIIVAYFNYTSGTRVNLVVWRSLDRGSNWQRITKRALRGDGFDVDPTNGTKILKTNLIVSNNVVVIIVEFRSLVTGQNKHVPLISRDGGTTFEQDVGISNGLYHSITAVALPNGTINLVYLDGTQSLKSLNIPHPGIKADGDYLTQREKTISTGTITFCSQVGTGLTAYLQNGDITSWYHEGYLYVIAKDTNNKIIGFLSEDNGETWQYISSEFVSTVALGTVFTPNSITVFKKLKSTVWEGRSVVFMNTSNSIAILYFGGFSSFSFPGLVDQPDRFQYANWDSNWIPNAFPDVSSVYTTTGSGTGTMGSLGLSINTSSNQKFYTYSGSQAEKQYLRWKMKVTTGNDLTTHYIGMLKSTDDSFNSYEVNIRFGTSGFLVHDGTALITNVTQDMTSFVEFVMFHDKTKVQLYYRVWDEKQGKVWTKLDLTINAQATGAGNSLRWGHTASFTAQSTWAEFHVGPIGLGKPNDDLRGSRYPAFGTFRYVDNGLLLTAKESPARNGEEYKIKPRYDYSVDNIFYQVSLSPRVVWRSTNTNLNFIPVFLDSVVKESARNLGLTDVLGIHLSNINWRTGKLKAWNGASWSTLATIDTSSGLSGTYQRVGSTLQPNAAGTDFYLHYDECREWRAELTSGESTVVVKIIQNSEGVWGNQGTSKRAILSFDTSLTDPSTIPTSGTIKLIPDRITIIHELLSSSGTPGEYALGIEIDNQTTLEGYHQIGSLVIGNVLFMAPQYQRGRNVSYSPNLQSAESLDGIFTARKLSEGRRTVSIAWTEPIDTRTIMGINMDYWQFSTTAGSQPVANYGDSPFQMLGLVKYLAGETPIVYLPQIKKSTGSNDFQVFNRYHNHLLGRTVGAVTLESVLGEELEDEMFRVATINIEEIE